MPHTKTLTSSGEFPSSQRLKAPKNKPATNQNAIQLVSETLQAKVKSQRQKKLTKQAELVQVTKN